MVLTQRTQNTIILYFANLSICGVSSWSINSSGFLTFSNNFLTVKSPSLNSSNTSSLTLKLFGRTSFLSRATSELNSFAEYETYLYDQKNKEINAKTEVIQQEDKNLELKLQRLDNERTQITTEIEAVEKVINDNIEASYKTFSG